MFSATAMKETASVPRGSLLLILCVLYVCVSVCVCVCVFDVGVYSTLRLNAYADRVDLLCEGSHIDQLLCRVRMRPWKWKPFGGGCWIRKLSEKNYLLVFNFEYQSTFTACMVLC